MSAVRRERKIPIVTLAEAKLEIKTKMHPTRPSGFNPIVGQILKKLPRKTVIKTTSLNKNIG